MLKIAISAFRETAITSTKKDDFSYPLENVIHSMNLQQNLND